MEFFKNPIELRRFYFFFNILLIAQHETTLSFSKNIVLKRNYKIFLFYKGVSKTTE
ncbi:hypothetical protein LEP1GSC186_1329 [Leptospira noguchii serovar Autumnalis str. ZUN142]|uniref:Uncharacterized protein n=1 Tax=Leptospira noguchii serovar Autumnalis str. ZUN142 TaxID=1085540 RepID=M6U4V7_9LEPT|nr:hypothetical protein LEP1GSC186_1329 [Leptospira noguchii serovar Autumnalis str. ZUN142]